MDARVTAELDDGVGVTVVDGEGTEHRVDVRADGAVLAHHREGHPVDPADCDPRQREVLAQARRYARHHAYRERGIPALSPPENPDRIAAALVAQAGMNATAVAHRFGELYRRVGDDRYDDLFAPAPTPVDDGTPRTYRQDVSVAEDTGTVADRFARWAGDRPGDRGVGDRPTDRGTGADGDGGGNGGDGGPVPLAELVAEALGPDAGAVEDAGATGGRGTVDLDAVATVDAVSEVYLGYEGPDGPARTAVDAPVEGVPDARLQLPPLSVDRFGAFRALLAVHLRAQVRDCYLGMGVDPPAFYRVLGPGRWALVGRYRHLDVYEDYHDVTADVDGYRSPMRE